MAIDGEKVEDLLGLLSSTNGIGGYEDDVRDKIAEKIDKRGYQHTTDSMGNLTVRVRGGDEKVMVVAHMDEVGFIAKHIDDDGFVWFERVGHIEDSLLEGAPLVTSNGLRGTIGSYPPHIRGKMEKKIFADFGFESKTDALDSGVRVGTPIYFDTKFSRRGDTLFGKGFDDRAGCATLLSLLTDLEPRCDLYLCFSVQEELGARGAKALGDRIKPDITIAVEGTSAGDTPGISKIDVPASMGQGPCITIMDRSIVANRKVVELLEGLANEEGIEYQIKKPSYGSTDAGVIIGSKSTVVSVPCRYIHSPMAIAKRGDLDGAVALVKSFLES